MRIVPLLDEPSQIVRATLGGQAVRLALRQLGQSLYCDVYVSDALVIGGVVCRDRNPIVRSRYLGFAGDLLFNDTQGRDDPLAPGIGSRFVLVYVGADELPR